MNAGATHFAMEADIPEEQKISPAGLFAGGAHATVPEERAHRAW
jgi:hypothetical protein